MDTARDGQLTQRYRCPSCGKRYVVAETESESEMSAVWG
jgi:transposase-like protein